MHPQRAEEEVQLPEQGAEIALRVEDEVSDSAYMTASVETVPTQDGSEAVMTVVEHLDELRWRIIRSAAVVAIAFMVALFYGKDFVRFLEIPAGNITFQALSLEEPLLVYFKVSFYAGLIIAFPYVLWEICQFIKPGLKKNERQVLTPIIFGGPILFVGGAAFAYYLVLPPMLNFFNSFGQAMSPIHQRLDFYISLVTTIMLYMGLCFQLPILLFALSLAGIVSSKLLLSVWRYAVFAAAFIAALITPDPTAMSMLIVAGALIGLYFLSVWLLKLFGR